jgi:hypothetical protein
MEEQTPVVSFDAYAGGFTKSAAVRLAIVVLIVGLMVLLRWTATRR